MTMNRILSIDVGIKNLAMCLIEEQTKLVRRLFSSVLRMQTTEPC